MQKKRKEYVLPEEIIESILKVKEEEGYKSEVAALIHIIKSYEEKKSITEEVRCISEEITDTMIQKNKAWMERVRWATKTAEVKFTDPHRCDQYYAADTGGEILFPY